MKRRRSRGLSSAPEVHREHFATSLRMARVALEVALSQPCGSRRLVNAMDALANAAQANSEHLAAAGESSKEAHKIMDLSRSVILTCAKG